MSGYTGSQLETFEFDRSSSPRARCATAPLRASSNPDAAPQRAPRRRSLQGQRTGGRALASDRRPRSEKDTRERERERGQEQTRDSHFGGRALHTHTNAPCAPAPPRKGRAKPTAFFEASALCFIVHLCRPWRNVRSALYFDFSYNSVVPSTEGGGGGAPVVCSVLLCVL
jgi:hypothetical protein